ncbi:hypothetical protein [Pseudomonas sp. UMAB-40]|uniref:hypothetical protein n=1 Tax=Pseudomonas sp. UMAB-40 TaxID=1365407 RepID=UPI001C59434B|nr:hypothetical protein [Pseudomonas sp. UMAB-40]
MTGFNLYTRSYQTSNEAKSIECGSMMLPVEQTNALPTYLSVAIHRASGYAVGWNISQRVPDHLTTLQTIEASLNSRILLGRSELSFIIDDSPEFGIIKQALRRLGHELQAYTPANPMAKVWVERFFKNINTEFMGVFAGLNSQASSFTPNVATLRRIFRSWLIEYHHCSLIHLSRAEAFDYFIARDIRSNNARAWKADLFETSIPSQPRHWPQRSQANRENAGIHSLDSRSNRRVRMIKAVPSRTEAAPHRVGKGQR